MAGMRLYRALCRVFPRSFRAKLMTVVLGGTLLPMLGFSLWLMANNGARPDHLLSGVLLALSLTLIGGVLSLLLVFRLLAPLREVAEAIDRYEREQVLPSLPEDCKDEIGQVMRAANCGLRHIDASRRELERMALECPLTHALNRRGSEHALLDSVAIAEREGTPLALYVVDIDNLKPVNDQLGHAAGDSMLVALVEGARGWLGERDWIGRWGGDEFLVGVHDTLPAANAKVEDWLEQLSASDRDVQVRASVGCAPYRPGEDAMRLYREADAAMYRAKAAGGRKLVCVVENTAALH